MVIDSMNRHLDACSKAIRNHLSPVNSPQTYSNAASPVSESTFRFASPKRPAVRTKSDNEKRAAANKRSLASAPGTTDSSGNNTERLVVPPGRSHRSRSWDSAAFGINPTKLAPLAAKLSVSPRLSRSQERKICVHCILQAEFDRKQLETEVKSDKFIQFRSSSIKRPDIVVSVSSADSSDSSTDSDEENNFFDSSSSSSKSKNATFHRRRRHKESSSDSDCIFNYSSSTGTSGAERSSLSDTDSTDSLILPAITCPLIPSISITQFFDVADYYTHPAEFTKTDRSGSLAASEADTLVPTACCSDAETLSRYSLSPPPSPTIRPHCESISSGYVGCSFPFPCVSLKTSKDAKYKRTSLFCGGGAAQTASFVSSAYLEAGVSSSIHQQRSSSIDIPSLHHDLHKADFAVDDVDISRSLSVDLSIPPMLASRTSSKARFISSFLRWVYWK